MVVEATIGMMMSKKMVVMKDDDMMAMVMSWDGSTSGFSCCLRRIVLMANICSFRWR